jgi:ribosomal protein L7Ae-like RNA K-turn-binding protein
VKTSVKQRKSELIILTSDASERLFDEMSTLTDGKNILRLNLTMEDISAAIGKRSGVLSINDEGFARVISDETTKEGFII